VSGGRAFEGALVPFTLTLDRVSTVPVSVDFITGDGTAERLRDYRGGRGTVTIPAGQLSATLQFTSLLDRLFEPDEQFRVELSNPVNARLDRHIDSATIANTLRTGRCANDVLVPAGISTLSGTSAGDRIRGRAASESLFGLAGHDCISGGRGHDLISGGDGNDVIDGDTGNDRLSGGSGNDRIDGGRGINRYSGGSGADRIDARNGRSERVDCGAGRDRVRADRSDRLRRCETVTR
jgi:Ca2+-binding RTX toxin-like protein